MKTHLLLLSLLACSLNARPQDGHITLDGHPQCGFDLALQQANINHTQLIEVYKRNIPAVQMQRLTSPVVYDIPVVFHIVYSAQMPMCNLPDSIIFNQVDVLNKAYRKQHADTNNTRAFFKPLSEDAYIQFHLATVDPSGKPTTGITRTKSKRNYFGNATMSLSSLDRIKSTADGGIDPWPTDKYLNIWVGNLSDEQGRMAMFGYSLPPLNPVPGNWDSTIGFPNIKDGVVIQTNVLGSNNPLSAQFQGMFGAGRTAVHEVGHYLGLMHIFGGTMGNSSASCGTSVQSDGIDDTPEQSEVSLANGCPSPTKNSCGSGPTDSLDLWEDYMDYTTDACQTMFTKGQIAIMRSVLANQRLSLTTNTASVNTVPIHPTIAIYPNPANNHISISYTGAIEKATIINFVGQAVLQFDASQANTKSYNVGDLNTGNYLLLLHTADGKRLTGRFTIANK